MVEFGWVRVVVRGMVRSKREGHKLRREIKTERWFEGEKNACRPD